MRRGTLLVLVFVLGCNNEGVVGTAGEEAVATASWVEAVPTAPGSYPITFSVDGVERFFILDIPETYSEANPAPLMLVNHGHGGSASKMRKQRGEELQKKAKENGIILVFTQGGRKEGKGYGWMSFEEGALAIPAEFGEYIDDDKYVVEVVTTLESALSIDPARIYMTGFSGGGKLCHYIAGKESGIFAAIAPVCSNVAKSGGMMQNGEFLFPPTPQGTISVYMVNGLRDTKNPWNGGLDSDGRPSLPIQAGADFWVEANGCDPEPERTYLFDNTVRVDWYTGGEAGTEVVQVGVKDLAHKWPDLKDGYGFSATQAVVDFFLQHPKQ